MKKTTLVIMAAGMGSRYGGLKQLDAIVPSGEIILDFSVYDAVKAGFNKVIFITRKDIEKEFRRIIGKRVENMIDTDYVIQDLSNLPDGVSVPGGREKPWGTGHAVYCVKVFPDSMDRKKCDIMKWTQTNPKSQEELLCQSKKEQCHLVMMKHSRVAQSRWLPNRGVLQKMLPPNSVYVLKLSNHGLSMPAEAHCQANRGINAPVCVN